MEITVLQGLLIAIIVAWGGWVSLTTIQNNGSVKTLLNDNANIRTDLVDAIKHMDKSSSDMQASFREMRDEVKTDIQSLSGRLDTFISTEIQALKVITGNK